MEITFDEGIKSILSDDDYENYGESKDGFTHFTKEIDTDELDSLTDEDEWEPMQEDGTR